MIMKKRIFLLVLVLLVNTCGALAGERKLAVLVNDVADTAVQGLQGSSTGTVMMMDRSSGRFRSCGDSFCNHLSQRISALIRFRLEGLKIITAGHDVRSTRRTSKKPLKAAELHRELAMVADKTSAHVIITCNCRKFFRNVDISFYVYSTAAKTLTALPRVRLPIIKEIKTLLRKDTSPEDLKASLARGIDSDLKETIRRIIRGHDQTDTDRLVDTAMKIPADSPAGIIHSLVMQRLIQSGEPHASYRNFILNALRQMQPGQDRTALSMSSDMIQYLSADGVVDDDEWEASLGCMAGVRDNQYIQSYLSALFRPLYRKGDYRTIISRVDRYFETMSGNRCGGAAEQDRAFTPMFAVLAGASSEFHSHEEAVYCCIRYYEPLLHPGSACYRIIKNMFFNEECMEQKNLVLSLACWYFNRREADEKHALDLLDFALSINRAAGGTCARDTSGASPQAVFTGLCGAAISRNFPLITDMTKRLRACIFCLSHGLPCDHLRPPQSDIETMLQSTDDDTVLQALDFCITADAGEYRELVLRIIQKNELNTRMGSSDIIKKGIEYLIAREEVDTESLALLTSLLKSRHYGVYHYARESMMQLKSREMAAHLIETIQKGDDFTALQAIQILKQTGMITDLVRPVLDNIIELQKNPWLVREAKQALAQVPDQAR